MREPKSRVERRAEKLLRERAEMVVEGDDGEVSSPQIRHLNVVRWLKENCWIQKKGGGTIRFDKWRPAQKRVAAIIVKLFALGIPGILVILKTRQLGISTVIQAIIFALLRMRPNTTGIVVAQTREATKGIFKNVKTHYDFLPKAEKDLLPVERGESGILELKYKTPWLSQFIVRVGEKGVRSQMVNFAHVSECDTIRDFKSVWSALLAAVPKKEVEPFTLIVAETTAKGKREFHSLWKQAQDPKNGMIPLFIGLLDDETARVPLEPGEVLDLSEEEAAYQEKYKLDDEQIKWVQQRLSEMFGDWNLFNSEYPIEADLAFGSGVGEFFKDAKIKEHLASARAPIFRGRIEYKDARSPKLKLTELPYGETTIWEHPLPGVRYVIGGDVGHGIFRDYTVAFVKRCDTRRTVAQWRTNKIAPGRAAVDLFCLGAYYRYPLMGIENNGPGIAMLTILQDGHSEFPQTKSGYPALYYQVSIDKKIQVESQRFGFATTGKSKTAVLEAYRNMYNTGIIPVDSKELLWEMDGFFYDSITRECAQSNQDPQSKMYHDDCVVAEAIAYAMTLESDRGSYCPAPEVWHYGVSA
jgi:hypothetical protein